MGNWALAAEDRPREKRLARGADTLGTNELLAVVLGTGTRRLSALELADEILSSAGGLAGLAQSSPDGLARLRGLKGGPAARVGGGPGLGRGGAQWVFGSSPRSLSRGGGSSGGGPHPVS